MRATLLSPEEVSAGYAALARLYPNIPPMILWRGWEWAAYRRFSLSEPVLDVGCGDGRYFQFVWPEIRDVSGVDADAGVADAARRLGVYREVYLSPAHRFDAPAGTFGSAFANCSLEHMDHLDGVLAGVNQSLKTGGKFLLSVVTDKILGWASLPLLVKQAGEEARAHALLAAYVEYHHYVNPFPPETWIGHLEQAGFEVLEHIPIVPEMTGRIFLLLDHLWHLPAAGGETGDYLFRSLEHAPRSPEGVQHVLRGLLMMERDWTIGCGAVFHACKRQPPG